MLVRKGTEADAEGISAHQLAMALETENRQLDRNILAEGVAAVFKDPLRGFYIVAEENGNVVGNLMVTTEWSDWTNRWVWWIQSVFVQQAYRKSGVYRSLYTEVKRLAGEASVRVIRLYVDQHNEAAMKAYEKLGMAGSHYRMYEEVID